MLYSATKLRELVDPAPILPPGLVVRPGKDARGFYPGELGRVHQTHMPRGAPGPFSKLQPAPVNYKAKTPFQPSFDNSALRKYVHFQKILRKPTPDWYSQTTYRAAFDLPYLKMDHENIYTPTTVPVPHTTWNKLPGQRMFSASQAYT
ncbi:uncharacterized protein C1orf100 homolog isoform X2 [Numida meleagris]|nr:uncharacterized protein C1orf100 homolog isoform X2 [Numida meleagris]XP_021248401.1 uncharacterized protein C1orf100 homolog isoform X2 [Numida meleagris]XP_021248402.1 uncharacterized protein C1orf100 homolog isoform X2 [Numida meleagris]XP_021248403.1 uncharacterized protein C1orf100 homolog isoform X2 [Numida meleagris]XP_021248404.1 uncharacterized protein C1orf100 homolog isoform X2 [Numida meleagris]XP_021248405.1 uncharacterized protein C1orf100 homolog isoform X2 [Numida meleagris]